MKCRACRGTGRGARPQRIGRVFPRVFTASCTVCLGTGHANIDRPFTSALLLRETAEAYYFLAKRRGDLFAGLISIPKA